MDLNDMRTNLTEDREAEKLLRGVLADARAVGEGELDEADFPDIAELWGDLLRVIGAST